MIESNNKSKGVLTVQATVYRLNLNSFFDIIYNEDGTQDEILVTDQNRINELTINREEAIKNNQFM